MIIAVCILTYKRYESFKNALQSIMMQRNSNGIVIGKIVVIDNEVNPDIETLCQETSEKIKYNITYIPEPKRGISNARNTAISAAKNDVDCIAFIDDDEEAASDWLYELAMAMEQTNSDIVTGNIISIFNYEAPDWVIKGKYFDRTTHRHLERINYARTGNVLMKVNVLDTCGYFDESLSLAGGEDMVYFKRANSLGKKITWSSKAIVYEAVDQNRCSVKWILKRSFRTAGTDVFSSVLLHKNKKLIKIKYIIYGIIRLIITILIAPFAVFAGFITIVKTLKILARGLGMILGVFGYHYKEYAKR